ncbi:MAG: signal peptidase I [Caulobacter sp.]|nr:signal peptidase I [Caulobacter sp.]
MVLAICLAPRTVLGQPFTIPSGSMEPTLLVGDYVIVNKFAYGWSRHSIPFDPPLPAGRLMGAEPRRGDVVVFKKPGDGRTDVIKRVVGLPGDRIRMVEGVLTLNDRPVSRRLVDSAVEAPWGQPMAVGRFRETLPDGRSYVTNSYGSATPGGNTGVYVVPAGCYFMMGDNRDNSLDSRFDPGPIAKGQSSCPWSGAPGANLPPEIGMGFVPFDDLVGRAELVAWSFEPGASVFKPWTLATHLRRGRAFLRL